MSKAKVSNTETYTCYGHQLENFLYFHLYVCLQSLSVKTQVRIVTELTHSNTYIKLGSMQSFL